ncbi:MAG: cysteine hydrolase [Acidimicrobiia bacterium]|nr:cysteine hydrolase [Acidimicrobiia bacterium]
MAHDFSAMFIPSQCAVLTMELQNGVVGESATIGDLAQEVNRVGVISNTARVLASARKAKATVVHCLAEFNADRKLMRANAPLLRMIARSDPHLIAGSSEVALVAELGPEPTDLISSRQHGLTPFPGTDLDQILSTRSIKTIVATGVSVNIGITGLAMVAVDLGYQVVLVTDAVAGVPHKYSESVIENTLKPLCTCLTTEEVVGYFEGQTRDA